MVDFYRGFGKGDNISSRIIYVLNRAKTLNYYYFLIALFNRKFCFVSSRFPSVLDADTLPTVPLRHYDILFIIFLR